MRVALFVGNHDKDTLAVRSGWAITRLAQKGPLGIVTHCEAIHEEYTDGRVRIASTSLRDGGVRPKDAMLTQDNWRIVDVPRWDVERSMEWFVRHDGEKYDLRGALATVLPGKGVLNRDFFQERKGLQ